MIDAALLLLLSEPVADPLVAEMQALESSRNAAIKAGNMAALEYIYAPDFRGISGNGTRVDRDTLFTVFRRNSGSGSGVTAESTILSARKEGELIMVEGRLKLFAGTERRQVSDSHYLHIFRRNGQRWEMIGGAAVPIAPTTR